MTEAELCHTVVYIAMQPHATFRSLGARRDNVRVVIQR
jgi:hypothetical protein